MSILQCKNSVYANKCSFPCARYFNVSIAVYHDNIAIVFLMVIVDIFIKK